MRRREDGDASGGEQQISRMAHWSGATGLAIASLRGSGDANGGEQQKKKGEKARLVDG